MSAIPKFDSTVATSNIGANEVFAVFRIFRNYEVSTLNVGKSTNSEKGLGWWLSQYI